MPWYLGKPGALVQLPAPSRGTQVPFAGGGATHQLLSGGQVVDKSPAKRSWQFTWQSLTRDQMGILDGFVYAIGGAGPYVLLDPEQRNLLDPNVSAGCSVTGDTTGFTLADVHFNLFVASGGSNLVGFGGPFPIWSSTTLGISVLSTAVLNNQILTTTRVPIISGTYTGSVYISNHTTTTGVAARINWLDVAGAWTLGSTVGSTVAAGATGRSVATGAAPAGAYYARIDLFITSSNTSGSTEFIDADGFQLEQASTVSAWVPGLSVPSVSVAPGGGRSRQQTNQNDYSLTLVEL